MVICLAIAIQTRMKDPFRVQGGGIDLQRTPKAKPKPKARRKPSKPPEGAEPELFDPLRFPDGRPFLRATTGMESVLFGIRKAR